MTAFAQALDVLFSDPNLSTPALYQQAGIGVEQALRVMRRSPDRWSSLARPGWSVTAWFWMSV